MPNQDFETFRFRVCRDLHGAIQHVSGGKRNGKPAIFLPQSFTDAAPTTNPRPDIRDQERLFVNLNPVERETWRKILSAQSIASIADEEGVSRAAIYARIQGNSKGQGGMIGKNFWVLLWWQLRQSLLTPRRQN